MKKIRLFILVLCMSLSVLLTSCFANGGFGGIGGNNPGGSSDTEGEGEGGGSGGGNNSTSKPLVWDQSSEIYVIFPEGAAWKQSFIDDFTYRTNNSPYPTRESNAKSAHEIVIGPSQRPASVAAYRLLDRNLGEEEDAEGYVIYALDGSVAIAYSSETSRMEAVSVFLSSFAVPSLRAENGYLYYNFFLLRERAEEDREALREEHFTAIEESHGKELADELRRFYGLFNTENYIWMANLFDPETGGFYFSNSARDNIGYLPDLESVYQVYMSLRVGGMFKGFGDMTSDAIPKSIQETTVKWVQGLQSSDGYFYHPQWGDNIATARRGRDLEWAESLLKNFGGKPYYNTPSGTQGIGAPVTGTASFATERLGTSVNRAVAKVTATASNLPSYLQSLDAWKSYIDGLNIWRRSYHAGNTLAADHTLIKRAGQQYIDYLLDYLDRTQNPTLGVWGSFEDEAEPGHGEAYQAYYLVNGVMKISTLYSSFGRPMPNIQATMDSTMRVALYEDLPELNETACYVYNPWVVMSQLVNSERKVNGNDAAEALRQQILDKAPELVSATVNKTITHIVDGGGFSYTELLPCNTSQGAPVACATEPEADVNANTLYISSTVDAMFSALGIEKIPVWCETDYYYFIDILTALGPTVKKEIYIPDVEPITFDDYIDEGKESEADFMPHEDVLIKTIDKEFFKPSIVTNPTAASRSDKVLRAETVVKKDADGKDVTARGPSSAFIHFANDALDGNCYVFDADIMVESFEKTNHPILQMFFTNLAMSYVSGFNLTVVEHKGAPAIRIYDIYGGLDGKSNANIYTGAALGEWINIRMELYKIYTPIETDDGPVDGEALNNLDVKVKIFINGEYVYTSDSGRILTSNPDSVVDSKIDQILLSHYRTNSSVIYYNDIYVAKSRQKYEPVVIYDPEVPNIPDAPIDPDTDHIYVAEFDNGILNDAYLHNYVPDGGHINVMAPNIDLNDYTDRIKYSLADNVGDRVSTVLKVETVKQSKYIYGQSSVKVSNTKPDGTTATFEMKVYFENPEKTTTFTQIFFRSEDNKKLASINFTSSENGYIYLSENNATEGENPGTGANVAIPGAFLPVDRWVSVRFVFFVTGSADTTRMKIYTDARDGETMQCVSDIVCYSPAAIMNPKNIAKVDIAHQRTAALTSYFDDVYLTRTALAYEAETLYPLTSLDVLNKTPEPEEPEDTVQPFESVIDFEGGKINTDYFTTTVGKLTSAGTEAGKDAHDPIDDGESLGGNLNTSLELRDDVAGKVGDTVLHITQNAAEKDNYNYTTTTITETRGPGEGDILTFRMEVMFEHTEISATALLMQMYFESQSYIGLNVFALPGEGDGVYLSFGYEYNVRNYIPYGEWVTIEIVYEAPVRGEASDYNMHFFIKSSKTGDVLTKVYTAAAKANENLMTKPSHMSKIYIMHYKSGEGSYYLDNITFTRTAENENLK